MNEKAWKRVEKRVARYLGAERTPLSGGSSRITRSDTTHEQLFIEVKHGRSFPTSWTGIRALFRKVEKMAEAEQKEPVVVLHGTGARGENG